MNGYSFENYIVAESNRFAKEACVQFVNNFGEKYNHLLICGATGTGKTHLLHAIKRSLEDGDLDMNIISITGEQFANEVIECLRSTSNAVSMNKIRKRYYAADLLIIDDIDWLQHLEATREELLHILEKVMNDNKKVVFSSTVGINELFLDYPKLKCLVELFTVVPIEKPDEILIDSIIKKNVIEGLSVSDDIKTYLREHSENSITRLKGMINTIKMWIDVYGKEPSLIELDNIFER